MSIKSVYVHLVGVLSVCSILAACSGMATSPAPVEDRTESQPQPRKQAQPETAPANVSEPRVTTLPVDEPAVITELPPPETQPAQSEPVVLAFLDEAETLAAKGDSARAIASLERGIRIKPKDPWLWHQLAVLKARSKKWLDAISSAEKSNSLAGNNRQLMIGNWTLMAEAYEAQGQLAAAEQARRQAVTLSGKQN